jgi:tRNA (mo5U34)-methyltransferase
MRVFPSPMRFDRLVRDALRFRKKLSTIRNAHPEVAWYPYDSFANVFQIASLLRSSGETLAGLENGRRVLDLGAGDGDLAFFFESLGFKTHAVDHADTNANKMAGIRTLATELGSQVAIRDIDMDAQFEIEGGYGLSLMLGLVYHLKNPLYALESIARASRYCFLSARVARFTPDHSIRLDAYPMAYLLDEREANNDATNYWVFSPFGLERLVSRSGWSVLARTRVGAESSDPVNPGNDERAFLLMKSNCSL